MISRTTVFTPSSLRSKTATLAPSSAKRCAVARPMPLAAPVTSATLPAMDRLSFVSRVIVLRPLPANFSHFLFPRTIGKVVRRGGGHYKVYLIDLLLLFSELIHLTDIFPEDLPARRLG